MNRSLGGVFVYRMVPQYSDFIHNFGKEPRHRSLLLYQQRFMTTGRHSLSRAISEGTSAKVGELCDFQGDFHDSDVDCALVHTPRGSNQSTSALYRSSRAP